MGDGGKDKMKLTKKQVKVDVSMSQICHEYEVALL